MNRLGVALACLLASASVGAAYSKPTTYNETFHVVVFKDRYLLSPHSWAIARAIYLIEKDGFATEAAVARKYLLPMLEGVTYNDVWGDADLAGGSILDYYVPDPEGTGDHNGFGCAVSSILNIFAYKNCTDTFESTPSTATRTPRKRRSSGTTTRSGSTEANGAAMRAT